MMTVCVPDESARDGLQPLPNGVRVLVWNGTGTPPDGIADTEFFVPPYMSGPVPAESLARMPRLEVIQLLSAGVEPWLDRVPDGVTLCNGRGVHGASSAELAVAGLLGLRRRLPEFRDAQREHRWAPLPGTGLDGARVLMLGAGDIGRRVAAALAAFDAEITFVARTLREGVHTLADVPDLLPAHQVVVIALPKTAETTRLVDAEFLAAMPDGATLVNIARGPIVDTDALLAELMTRRLSAFLDVTDPEPLPSDHPLWDAPNLLLTPHVGGGTSGWRQRGDRLVRAQLERFVAGEPLQNVVTDAY